MVSTLIYVKYRPVRIGFLVKDGNLDDLLKTSELNTLLWGGVYNPIIPVGENDEFTDQLIELFRVDVLYSVNQDADIQKVIHKHSYIKNVAVMPKHVR